MWNGNCELHACMLRYKEEKFDELRDAHSVIIIIGCREVLTYTDHEPTTYNKLFILRL